ncbi:MAG: class I SAM-dependent methyltransferase [Polyangiales bacterium]
MADHDSREGASYANRAIVEWLDALHHPLDAAAQRAFDSPGVEGIPAVQVGRPEAALLSLLLRLHGARKVVEVGALAGFSALNIARALPPEGHLWTVEFSPRHAAITRANLDAAGLSTRVTVREGAGADVLPTLSPEGPFDAVFLDADKAGYLGYARWADENLRPGGMLIADNTFLFGRLLEDSEEAEKVRAFHQFARARFDTHHVPTPDGMLVGLKRAAP